MIWKKFFLLLAVNVAITVLLMCAVYFFCEPGRQTKYLSNMLVTLSVSVDSFLVIWFLLSRAQLEKSK